MTFVGQRVSLGIDERWRSSCNVCVLMAPVTSGASGLFGELDDGLIRLMSEAVVRDGAGGGLRVGTGRGGVGWGGFCGGTGPSQLVNLSQCLWRRKRGALQEERGSGAGISHS
uniref:Uncharacterized protein n=1 Tax=Knipowitschia caucasica TaxID=637954 RepID=A0AAV2M8N0_KNICA